MFNSLSKNGMGSEVVGGADEVAISYKVEEKGWKDRRKESV